MELGKRTARKLAARKLALIGLMLAAALSGIAAGSGAAAAQDALKVAVPQRGAWDAGIAELGRRGGIFKKHGLDLEILYTQAGPESIQALIAGSVDIATAAGVSALLAQPDNLMFVAEVDSMPVGYAYAQ